MTYACYVQNKFDKRPTPQLDTTDTVEWHRLIDGVMHKAVYVDTINRTVTYEKETADNTAAGR
jgi:hypothetical protein